MADAEGSPSHAMSAPLADRNCVPCRKGKPGEKGPALDKEEREALLPQLHEDWQVVGGEEGGSGPCRLQVRPHTSFLSVASRSFPFSFRCICPPLRSEIEENVGWWVSREKI